MDDASDRFYDVMIAGGGLAGSTLARLLRQRMPELSVVVVDKLTRPLPEAAFKVGESTLSPGGYFLQEVLGLKDYLQERHILKFGLRYFFPPDADGFHTRPELGRSRYRALPSGSHAVPEWQLDRGRLENDLRAFNQRDGVELIEGFQVDDVAFGANEHRVGISAVAGGEARTIRARWFVDAMGRRRLLQRRLGLGKELDLPRHSACWFRLDRRLDVSDFVGAEHAGWHARVPGAHPTDPSYGRYNSTNHLMGDGYWVWLIPLSSGATSVGIVVQEGIRDFDEIRTFERALAWLERHEPAVARAVGGVAPMDFRSLRGYSLASHRVLSHERWACTGEAGCFQDPFYSPGSDAIAVMNSIICEAIGLDRRGHFDAPLASSLSEAFIRWSELLTRTIQAGYPHFGKPVVAALKTMWDMTIGYVTYGLFFNAVSKEGFVTASRGWLTPDVVATIDRGLAINQAVLALFAQWGASTRGTFRFEFLEILEDHPVLSETYDHEAHATQLSPADVVRRGVERMESMALAIFLLAVEDVAPEQLSRLDARALDAGAVGLDPARWHDDGLFRPSVDMDRPRKYHARLRARLTGVGLDRAVA